MVHMTSRNTSRNSRKFHLLITYIGLTTLIFHTGQKTHLRRYESVLWIAVSPCGLWNVNTFRFTPFNILQYWVWPVIAVLPNPLQTIKIGVIIMQSWRGHPRSSCSACSSDFMASSQRERVENSLSSYLLTPSTRVQGTTCGISSLNIEHRTQGQFMEGFLLRSSRIPWAAYLQLILSSLQLFAESS